MLQNWGVAARSSSSARGDDGRHAHGNQERLIALPVEEFLRRFLLHLLPRGFMRIRNFGFLANRRRAELLPLCSRLLQSSDHPAVATASPAALRIPSLWRCPLREGTMQVVERLSAAHAGSVSRTCRNAVWRCDLDSPMRRPTLILSLTRY